MRHVTVDTSMWVDVKIIRNTFAVVNGLLPMHFVVSYHKHNTLEWTDLELVEVEDLAEPQEGETFAALGKGLYAFYLDSGILDTVGTFTLVVEPSDPEVQDFLTECVILDIRVPDTYVQNVETILSDVGDLETLITESFDAVTASITETQVTVGTIDDKADSIITTVDSIDDQIVESLYPSFV